jgi:lysyl-tRNA synthetase class 2
MALDPNLQDLDEQTRVRREKLQKLRDAGQAYPHFVEVKNHIGELLEYESEKDAEKLKSLGSFSIAGRVQFIRAFGKAGFVKIRDRQASLQLYVAKDQVSEKDFETYKSVDLGDVVRVVGYLFRTKTNELSLHVQSFELLVKCLHAPPEKFHGLSDVEERYRKRYLDLMSNDRAREVFKIRSRMVQEIRNFFLEKDFLEVETPMMHPLVGGAAARPFITHHNTLDMDLYLRIAPELYLKRLVVGGFERVFEVNRNFRNEGISVRHNPEFTMLEYYMAYATYHTLMDMTEELVSRLVTTLFAGKTSVTYQGKEIEFAKPWKRVSMETAVKNLSGFKGSVKDAAALRKYLKDRGTELSGREGPGALLTMVFELDVEHQLLQPTFVTGYPVEVSPLARRSDEKSPEGYDVTDRFELFVNGQEIANGFNELNDPDDQRERFEAQLKEKAAGNAEATDFDADYIQALEYGLPPTAGEGIGIDRLAMLLTDSPSIRDVILFPQLKKQVKEAESEPEKKK